MENPKWRVKLFRLLNDGSWEDRTIGQLQIISEPIALSTPDSSIENCSPHTCQLSHSKTPPQFQIECEKTKKFVMDFPINSHVFFSRQKGNILSWRIVKPIEQYLYSSISDSLEDKYSEDNDQCYAVSFQKAEGVNRISQRLLELTGILPRMEWDGESDMLPEPCIENLTKIYSTVRIDLLVTESKELVEELTRNNGNYLKRLFELFKGLESKGSAESESLKTIFRIFKNILYFGTQELFEILVNRENYQASFGILEYNPDNKNSAHREFLLKSSRFKNLLNIKNRQFIEKISHVYRLAYLRDIATSSFLEENALRALNQTIKAKNTEIIHYFIDNKNLLFTLIDMTFKPETDKEAFRMIFELLDVTKDVKNDNYRNKLYQTLLEQGIMRSIENGIHKASEIHSVKSDELILKGNLLELVYQMLLGVPEKVANYIQCEDQLTRKHAFLNELTEFMIYEQSEGLLHQICEVLKYISQLNKIKYELFTRRVLTQLVSALKKYIIKLKTKADLPKVNSLQELREIKASIENDNTDYVKYSDELDIDQVSEFSILRIIELLTFCVRQQPSSLKSWLIYYDVVQDIGELTVLAPNKFVLLDAVKFLKVVLGMPEYIFYKIVLNNNILDPFLLYFDKRAKQGHNILTSCIISLFQFNRHEDISKNFLIKLFERYSEFFKSHVDFNWLVSECELVMSKQGNEDKEKEDCEILDDQIDRTMEVDDHQQSSNDLEKEEERRHKGESPDSSKSRKSSIKEANGVSARKEESEELLKRKRKNL